MGLGSYLDAAAISVQKHAVTELVTACPVLLWFCVLGSAPGFPAPVITFLSVFPCRWAAGTPQAEDS